MEKIEKHPGISIPEEVRPLYLVTMPSDLPVVYAEARDVFARYRELPYRTLLAQAELLFQDAWGVRDRHIAALARLYQSDLYQRLGKNERALSASHMSAKWLALQVPVQARYEEAVARYFGGLLWYLQGKLQRAMGALSAAAKLLTETERSWRYGGGHPQLAHCERLQRWIADLLALRVRAWRQPEVMILPVYVWREDNVVELDGATAANWRDLLLDEGAHDVPRQVGAAQSEDELPTSEMYYFAVKLDKASASARVEDIVYVEAEPKVEIDAEEGPGGRIPFEFITGKVQGKLIMGREDER